jgi:hypothetical protein
MAGLSAGREPFGLFKTPHLATRPQSRPHTQNVPQNRPATAGSRPTPNQTRPQTNPPPQTRPKTAKNPATAGSSTTPASSRTSWPRLATWPSCPTFSTATPWRSSWRRSRATSWPVSGLDCVVTFCAGSSFLSGGLFHLSSFGCFGGRLRKKAGGAMRVSGLNPCALERLEKGRGPRLPDCPTDAGLPDQPWTAPGPTPDCRRPAARRDQAPARRARGQGF